VKEDREMKLRCPYCKEYHEVENATGPDDAWHAACWTKAVQEEKPSTERGQLPGEYPSEL